MDRSRTITLFAEVPAARRGPSGFLVSTLVHVAVMGLGYVYMRQALRVTDLIANQRYNVRLINVESPQLRRMRSGGGGGGTPDLAALMHAAGPAGQASPLIHEVVRPVRAAQALIQPDLPPNLLLTKQVPLPQVLIWSSGHTPAVTITPPPPLPVNAPITHPSLETPNEQLKIAELKISASTFGASALALPPSTTSPMVVKRAQQPMQMPAIASTPVGTATPARVISLSDVQLERGTIALPALNELGATDGVDDPSAEKGQSGNSGKGTGKQNASATGSGNGDRGSDASSAGGNSQRAAAGAGGQGSAPEGLGRGALDGGTSGSADGGGVGGAGAADAASVTEIRQPMDGQFSAVVVGSSIAERYPETMQLWAGRLAYTVYLHMGVQKNWILQYAATREAASAGGDVTQPHAPWPYLMERPHLAPGDFNSDAVMVHGLLNTSGHFEALAVVFPSDFSQAQFVLSALKQWRFRPARQGGRIIAVEVLLIIPEEED